MYCQNGQVLNQGAFQYHIQSKDSKASVRFTFKWILEGNYFKSLRNTINSHLRMIFSMISAFVFFLPKPVENSNEFSNFVSAYKMAIENYIMVGYGGGWEKCDNILISPIGPNSSSDVPQVVQEIIQLKTIDVSSTLAYSRCIIVIAPAHDNMTLSALIEFGWSAVQHKRVGMMLKLGSNITLDKAKNITKVPFLIAAKLESGKEQFLCPTIKSYHPILQQSVCQQHHTNYKGKTIRVGLYIGLKPYGYMSYNSACNCSVPEGVDYRFLKYLKAKLNFKIKIASLYWLGEQGFELVIYTYTYI